MIGAAWLLAWRSLADRPWRSAILLLGYGVGVAVMIALLSVGEALLSEARDRDLVAGGDLVLLPEGVDPAVLKVNGVTGLYFTIPQARFLVRDLLAGPRFGPEIGAAAPQIQGRVVYLKVRGKVVSAAASAGIPSLDQAVHATEAVPGAQDSPADHAWVAPSPEALFDRLDHFHGPPPGHRSEWAEWDYFNFIDPATGAAGYLTLLAGGEGRGAILTRLRRPDRTVEDLAIPAVIHPGDVSLTTAAQRIGPARVDIQGGRYHIVVNDPRLHADLWLSPEADVYLPPGESEDDAVISGYVVPAVRGEMSGGIRTARTAIELTQAVGYHDHNWGTWRGVTWEWGEASSPRGAVLYGALHVAQERAPGAQQRLPSGGGHPPALFLWGSVGDGRGGFTGAFSVRQIDYAGWRPGPTVAGHRVRAPSEVTITANQGGDTVRLHLRVDEALGSLLASPGVTGPRSPAGSAGSRQVFLQLRGIADVRGAVDGREITWSGPGAAETFVALSLK